MSKVNSAILLERVQNGAPLSRGEQIRLALLLSVPAILAQISTILMEYIDASMVGHLGASASAAIGLVSTSTWLLGGICSAAAAGFAVQVAHAIGASEVEKARHILRIALRCVLILSVIISLIAMLISRFLPHWLGGGEEICRDASLYFFCFSLSIPVYGLSYLCSSMLRCAGNMKVPSITNIYACLADVAFNYYFIYILGLGVLGAALGTMLSMIMSTSFLLWYTFRKDKTLGGIGHLRHIHKLFRIGDVVRDENKPVLREAWRIGLPMAVEHFAMCSAQIVGTIIVAPLGTAAIAANAFGVIIEGLCYMPGYGIGDAATTLVGQSIGAKRPELTRSFSYLTVLLGIDFMSLMGVLMYMGVPYLMPLMTTDLTVSQLTVEILRIEAFAEPWYAASIVCYGVFVGHGDTKMPCIMNLGSIWAVRIPLAAILAKTMGLRGVWIAMATELTFRGLIFIERLIRKNK